MPRKGENTKDCASWESGTEDISAQDVFSPWLALRRTRACLRGTLVVLIISDVLLVHRKIITGFTELSLQVIKRLSTHFNNFPFDWFAIPRKHYTIIWEMRKFVSFFHSFLRTRRTSCSKSNIRQSHVEMKGMGNDNQIMFEYTIESALSVCKTL